MFFPTKPSLWFCHWSSQFGGICRLDHLLQIINKDVNKTAHRYLHFMTKQSPHGALVPPAYLPDSMSFCTYTWGRYPFAVFCHFWGPSSHNSNLLSTFDLFFLTCPPNSWFKIILLSHWPDCWQGCWQGYLLLTRTCLPHFLRWILSLYPGVLSAQNESHGPRSRIPVVIHQDSSALT